MYYKLESIAEMWGQKGFNCKKCYFQKIPDTLSAANSSSSSEQDDEELNGEVTEMFNSDEVKLHPATHLTVLALTATPRTVQFSATIS